MQGLITAFYSTNNAATWTQTSLTNETVNALVINGSTFVAGTNFDGVFISTNSGANWTQTSLNDKDVYSLTVNNGVIYAGTVGSGIYISTNNGQTWIQKNQGLGNQSIYGLLIANGNIYSGTEANGVWKRSISDIIGIRQISEQVPDNFKLNQNYPNPFNPSTTIEYSILKSGKVKLIVYDITGKNVRTLVDQIQSPGIYQFDFNASQLTSGVYFYKLESGGFTEVRKMFLVK